MITWPDGVDNLTSPEMRNPAEKGAVIHSLSNSVAVVALGTDPNPSARDIIRSLIDQTVEGGRPAYIFVNNRFEGNAPSTIQSIVDPDPEDSD